MSQPVDTYYPILVRRKGWSPFRRGTAWNPKTGKYDRVWVKNWQPVYVKQMPGFLSKHLGPEPGYKKALNLSERKNVTRWARSRGYAAKLGDPITIRRYPFLDGDTDAGTDLLARLNRVGKRLGKKLWIASGYRSNAEQQILYDRYLSGNGPLAAAPGQSNHNRHGAADVHIDGVNIGAYPGAREALKAEGLSLPVAGENWHVEVGNTWRA
jgi:hypothetical protein